MGFKYIYYHSKSALKVSVFQSSRDQTWNCMMHFVRPKAGTQPAGPNSNRQFEWGDNLYKIKINMAEAGEIIGIVDGKIRGISPQKSSNDSVKVGKIFHNFEGHPSKTLFINSKTTRENEQSTQNYVEKKGLTLTLIVGNQEQAVNIGLFPAETIILKQILEIFISKALEEIPRAQDVGTKKYNNIPQSSENIQV